MRRSSYPCHMSVADRTLSSQPTPSRLDLFVAFAGVGLMGFGGVLPIARVVLVERRRWLTAEEFTDLLALCQFLPGGNILNMAAAVGLRFGGPLGAACAVCGMMGPPVLVVLLMGVIYERYRDLPLVRGLFIGLAAAAAGLIVAVTIRLAMPLRPQAGRRRRGAAVLRGDCVAAPAIAGRDAGDGAAEHVAGLAVSRMNDLATLAAIFGRLSLLAFGGGNTVLPEMQREVVEVHHWMTPADFAALFALAQAAPGPNMMVVSLIGYRVAGVAGALISTLGIIVPSSILTMVLVSFWHRFREARWRKVVQAGLVPVTIGLLAASATLIVVAADTGMLMGAVTAAVAATVLVKRVHPLWLLGAGAIIGMIFAS